MIPARLVLDMSGFEHEPGVERGDLHPDVAAAVTIATDDDMAPGAMVMVLRREASGSVEIGIIEKGTPERTRKGGRKDGKDSSHASGRA